MGEPQNEEPANDRYLAHLKSIGIWDELEYPPMLERLVCDNQANHLRKRPKHNPIITLVVYYYQPASGYLSDYYGQPEQDPLAPHWRKSSVSKYSNVYSTIDWARRRKVYTDVLGTGTRPHLTMHIECSICQQPITVNRDKYLEAIFHEIRLGVSPITLDALRARLHEMASAR